jgi:hypothetical protein
MDGIVLPAAVVFWWQQDGTGVENGRVQSRDAPVSPRRQRCRTHLHPRVASGTYTLPVRGTLPEPAETPDGRCQCVVFAPFVLQSLSRHRCYDRACVQRRSLALSVAFLRLMPKTCSTVCLRNPSPKCWSRWRTFCVKHTTPLQCFS